MGSGRDGDQVGSGPVLPVDSLHELLEELCVGGILPEAHDVHAHLLLLQLLGQLDQGRLLAHNRGPDEQDDPGLVVLALTVLQRQLQQDSEEKEKQI